MTGTHLSVSSEKSLDCYPEAEISGAVLLTPTNYLVWLLAQSPVHFALVRLIVGVIHKVPAPMPLRVRPILQLWPVCALPAKVRLACCGEFPSALRCAWLRTTSRLSSIENNALVSSLCPQFAVTR